MIRPLQAVLRAQFFNQLQYRGAAVGGLITQIFFGLVLAMIYKAVYSSSKVPVPMEISQVVTYVWLGQIFFAMQPWSPDAEVRQMMRSGSVAYELTRPCSLYGLWFVRALAARSAPTLMRAIPMAILALAFFGLKLPASAASAGWWVLSVLAALFLSSAIMVVLNCVLFWTITGDGVVMMMPALVLGLSGANIPLPLFPIWMQTFLQWQPFRGLLDVPARIYSGSIPPSQALANIAGQWAWCLVFIFIGRAMATRGARRLVVQGG